MTVETVTVGNSLVARCVEYPFRWYDAWGDNVVKYRMNTAACPTDNTTGMPTEFTSTLVGASTFAHTDVQGGAVLLTAAGAADDGVKLQLGSELAAGPNGENVYFAHRYPTYFHVRLQINDVDQTDFLAGFCVTDTACLDAVADGLYFRSVDETAVVNFVLEQGSAETVTAVDTMTDDTDVDLEFTYSADGYVRVYVNTVLMATIADTDANFCNDQLLRLTFEFLDGEAIGNTCTLKRLEFIQIQD
jgi:hypothetical protein